MNSAAINRAGEGSDREHLPGSRLIPSFPLPLPACGLCAAFPGALNRNKAFRTSRAVPLLKNSSRYVTLRASRGDGFNYPLLVVPSLPSPPSPPLSPLLIRFLRDKSLLREKARALMSVHRRVG